MPWRNVGQGRSAWWWMLLCSAVKLQHAWRMNDVLSHSHLMEVAMLKEAHVRPQPVVRGRELGAQLGRQLVQLQRPLAQRKAADTPQNIKLMLLLLA